MKTGSCLCKAVAFELHGPLRPSVSCHCTQCRKTSGHFWSATQVDDDRLQITKDDGLVWFRSSQKAERGFCSRCGSSLFWRLDGEGKTSVGSGCIDGQTDLKTAKHIYLEDKGDYYALPDEELSK